MKEELLKFLIEILLIMHNIAKKNTFLCTICTHCKCKKVCVSIDNIEKTC